MNKEIWKPIKNYEGWYEVSNLGRVRSLDRLVIFNKKAKKGAKERFYKGKIKSLKYHNGYAMVNLLKNKDLNVVYVHRLVAETFLPRIAGKNEVNHKNGIKSDNRVENLEWCTRLENNLHARQTGLHSYDNVDGLIEYSNGLKKKVAALQDNKIVFMADCSKDMAKILFERGIVENAQLTTVGRNIRRCASEGGRYMGFYFQYIENI